uniref:hypothetical protein n=1 Tax=Tabrizicola sp. TaxID=2005166 RepID=UPI0035AFD488
RAVRTELPRQRAAADAALVWVSLGITDRRTREARAARKALRAGGVDRARAVVDALRAASSAAVDVPLDKGKDAPAGPLTALPVRPWTAGAAADGWKRRQSDRQKPPPAPARPPNPLGRPPRVPDGPEDVAAYGAVLRAAGPQVRAMYEAIPRQEDRLRFLRDLAGYANAPVDAGALRRWMVWVSRSR